MKQSLLNINQIIMTLIQNRIFSMRFNHWSKKAIFSVLDQGIFSGTNFVINILLARWLIAEYYGLFASFFALFLFLAGFQNALILEPISVLGASRHVEHLLYYLKKQIIIHFYLTGAISIFVCLIGGIFVKDKTAFIFFLEMGASLPFILMFWMIRQACYINTKSELALSGSLWYGGILLTLTLVLKNQYLQIPAHIFLMMAFASLLASLFTWYRMKSKEAKTQTDEVNFPIKTILIENWRYGKWIMSATIASGISSFAYLPLIGIFLGLTQVGILRASQNLVLPLTQLLTALNLLILPWGAKQKAKQEGIYIQRTTVHIILIYTCLACGYTLFLILLGEQLLNILYPFNDSYTYVQTLWFLSIAGLINGIAQGISIVLRTLEFPNSILWAKSGSAISVISLVILLTWKWGFFGTMIGLIITSLVELSILLYFYVVARRNLLSIS